MKDYQMLLILLELKIEIDIDNYQTFHKID